MIERCVTADEKSISWNFYVFSNRIPFISVARKRAGVLEVAWLDGNGEKLPFQKDSRNVLQYEMPPNFQSAKKAARAIGRQFGFVRVDYLFGPDGKIYLGEVTFTPGNGLTHRPAEFENYLGGLWKLT